MHNVFWQCMTAELFLEAHSCLGAKKVSVRKGLRNNVKL